jgi:hypothetical protein
MGFRGLKCLEKEGLKGSMGFISSREPIETGP